MYQGIAGPAARDAVVKAIGEISPRRVLEVGCGWGDLAVRLEREIEAEVVAVDVSPRMVELAGAQGVDARVADVQSLPFDDGDFRLCDCQLDALPRGRSGPRALRARMHFVRVERRVLESTMTFADATAVRGYVASLVAHKHLAVRVPELAGPLVATRRNSVFVAEKARA